MTQQAHFIHLYNHFQDGTRDNNGGVTIAYMVDGHSVRYAFAKCRTTDRFCKRMGRVKSQGRLNSPAQSFSFSFTPPENSGIPHKDIIPKLIKQYYQSVEPYFTDVKKYIY